jgi:hypothetical protein
VRAAEKHPRTGGAAKLRGLLSEVPRTPLAEAVNVTLDWLAARTADPAATT